MTDLGVVVLSMGDRREELARLLRSLLTQRDVDLDLLVVGNGWEPAGLPAGVRTVALADNVGIPEGRNVGAGEVVGDLLLFADDDLEFRDPMTLREVRDRFDADPALGVLQPRAVDPAGGATARRHVPRLRTSDPTRAGDVVWFWEGCSFVRRSALDAAGGWPGRFWYGHEGIEVAWRVIDAGYRVHYAADLSVDNPAAPAFRAPRRQYTNARNRVWVARRNLPHGPLEAYLLVWVTVTLLRAFRAGSLEALTAALRGFADGVRQPAGERRPLSWRAVWRMTRLGRPPIV